MSDDTKRLKDLIEDTFNVHCETGLSTLKYNVVNSVIGDAETLDVKLF